MTFRLAESQTIVGWRRLANGSGIEVTKRLLTTSVWAVIARCPSYAGMCTITDATPSGTIPAISPMVLVSPTD